MTDEAAGASVGRGRGLALLGVAVVAVGAAAVLAREVAAPPATIALWRLLLGGLGLLLIARLRASPPLSAPHRRRALLAGLLLALHFWSWIASLQLTSVAASVVLVCLQPVFVAVLARVFLGERTALGAWWGIAVALGGTALLVQTDAASTPMPMPILGDALALAGAVAIALYVLVGRRATRDSDVLSYSAAVTTSAALFLVPVVVVAWLWRGDSPVPTDAHSWCFVALLAAGPQLLGHTALNAALARLPASTVSGAILGEPVIAIALAAVFLDERPGLLAIVGSAVVLCGLWLLLRADRSLA